MQNLYFTLIVEVEEILVAVHFKFMYSLLINARLVDSGPNRKLRLFPTHDRKLDPNIQVSGAFLYMSITASMTRSSRLSSLSTSFNHNFHEMESLYEF